MYCYVFVCWELEDMMGYQSGNRMEEIEKAAPVPQLLTNIQEEYNKACKNTI